MSKFIKKFFDPAALCRKFEIYIKKYFDIWGKFEEYPTTDLLFNF